MEFRILGPLDVVEGERVVGLAAAKHRALLAMLLLYANEIVSTERLIDALWEEQPPDGARKTLQVYISQLRKTLGQDRVQTRAPGYLVRVDAGELDLARFQRLTEDGRFKEALQLWRGPPLAEFANERFAQGEIARLEELRLSCLERRIEGDLEEGRHAELVAELESLVQIHPLREHARAQLMLALYRSGRQVEALDAYQGARRVLVDELGIEPGRTLRELERAILAQSPSLDLVSTDNERSESAEASSGAFVGREVELTELLAGLDATIAGRGRLFLISASRGSERAGSRTRWSAQRGHAGPGSSPAVVGRPAGRPRTGRGCSHYAPTCGSRSPTSSAHSSAPAPSIWRRSCPSFASSFPASPSRPRPTRRERDSDCSTRQASSFATHRHIARSCLCSTTSTPPTLHRSYCCSSLRASWTRPASSWSPLAAMSTRFPESR
jgi:DNA-binding SARP family transcriptional activator